MIKIDSIVIQSHEKFEEALEKLLMAGEEDEDDDDDDDGDENDEDEGYGSEMDTIGENDETCDGHEKLAQ